jgi:uncharacterized protein (DUF1778 family)
MPSLHLTFSYNRNFSVGSKILELGPVTASTTGIVYVRQLVYNWRMAIKTERLSIRLTPEQDIVLRRAAEVRGESTNDYVLRNAVGAAQSDLADLRLFVATENEWREIESALSQPVTLTAAMVKLLTSPSVLER